MRLVVFLLTLFEYATSFLTKYECYPNRIPRVYRQKRKQDEQSPICDALMFAVKEDWGITDLSLSKTTCKYCGQEFSTRNALFRHIRSDPICSSEASPNDGIMKAVKETLAFQFGYTDFATTNDNTDRESIGATKAELVGKSIQETLVLSLLNVMEQQVENRNTTTSSKTIEILGTTQSSLAKLRHHSLSQESTCAAEGDVIVINAMVPEGMSNEIWTCVFEDMRKILLQLHEDIELFSCQIMGSDYSLHAERSATQYIYHYMLPLSWLPNPEVLYKWWESAEAPSINKHNGRKLASKPPNSLRNLKNALRTVESSKIDVKGISSERRKAMKLASGRFGALGSRERRPFHNFADPDLKGDASPNNEPVWRVIDRARIIDFVDQKNVEGQRELYAIIEIKGDGFVKQQIRRIIGTAVAISNGWLPKDFFAFATRNDVFLETPIAPKRYLYLKGVRYHFDEMMSEGLPFFQAHETRNIFDVCPSDIYRNWAQNAILSNLSSLERESTWLNDLEHIVSKRIQAEIDKEQNIDEGLHLGLGSSKVDCPEAYLRVFHELERILSSGCWPETSIARSSLIRVQQQQDIHVMNNEDESRIPDYGSFTIVNPDAKKNWDNLPLGNSLFPELVDAVFSLESTIKRQDQVDSLTIDASLSNVVIKDRPSSSHCAVNCNAQFTPHVDSGRGSGQTLSMIVGLGDYSGGELLVEGVAYDIKYKPLVFDGWKLRHWTNRFAGRRFSLVWFTPEAKD